MFQVLIITKAGGLFQPTLKPGERLDENQVLIFLWNDNEVCSGTEDTILGMCSEAHYYLFSYV